MEVKVHAVHTLYLCMKFSSQVSRSTSALLQELKLKLKDLCQKELREIQIQFHVIITTGNTKYETRILCRIP